ncbi:MAG: ABC transporter permease subunit [Bacillota bacterium]|nr:ABC transporter permease subunit [Bacillota bacterium]
MTSITSNKKNKKIKLWAVLFWLLVWEIVSIWLGQEILLVSPVAVLKRLGSLIFEASFWKTVGFSFFRIIGGFFLAVLAGVLGGSVASKFQKIEELFAPLILAMKSVPVASFVILILIWVSSENLSVTISFLMVFPVIYTNVLNGIQNTDKNLLEMAQVFQVSGKNKIRYIYLSEVLPFFRAGCSVSLGLCWKAGVAAEVIGIPDGSMGERLYEAKVYLDTPELFAWTMVILVVSMIFEKIFLAALDKAVSWIERM